MDYTTSDSKKFFLCGMRFFFGLWLLYAGLFKVIFLGPDNFVNFLVAEFSKTWVPPVLTAILSWIILIAEPVLALFILSGIKARTAWTLTTLLMFLLVIGQSILMKPEVIANWQYLVLTLVCASLSTDQKA